MARYRGGFTLIELLVVIAIIGLLATLILPSLTGARTRAKNTRLQSDAHQLSVLMESKSTVTGIYPGNADNGSETLTAAPWTASPFSDLLTDITNQGGNAGLKVWQGPGKSTFAVFVKYTDQGGVCYDYTGGTKAFTSGTAFSAASSFNTCAAATGL